MYEVIALAGYDGFICDTQMLFVVLVFIICVFMSIM